MKKPDYHHIFANAPDGDERAAMAGFEWAALIEDLDARGQLTDQRKRIIDRLVRERVEYEFLYPVVAAEGPAKKGPNGGDLPCLRWHGLQKIKTQIAKLEDQLKITIPHASDAEGPEKPTSAADRYLRRIRPC